ncbi:hypothetical protein RND81_06G230600 [Saponaria officinalis]|uniref:F-box domain-containing protein n=1 Tax=Saponaria officinalis TaxID=3572 RepID=A0AAW1KDE2_SAPOF
MCLLENNSRHASDPCIRKGHEVSSSETNDRLPELPRDVLLLILSSFTTKEVKRTSLISKKWNTWLLGFYPKINFEPSKTIKDTWYEIRNNDDELAKKRTKFVTWVDQVLKQHVDSSIDEFRVVFDLDNSWQSHVDKWVSFALTKQVKTLDFNFQPVYDRLDTLLNRCGLTIDHCTPLPGFNHSLTTLRLRDVNITSEAVESILLSCPFLENLNIIYSELLTSIKCRASLVSLKHFDVSCCFKLKKIDISAPKMVCFRYRGKPVELNIRNAVSLSSVYIAAGPGEDILYAFDHPAMYLPQLEALSLGIPVADFASELTVGVKLLKFPVLTTLKVLDISIRGCHLSSFLSWTPLIEACPALEKLTFKVDYCYDCGIDWKILDRRDGSPLVSLKTFEILSYAGRRIDIELAGFIFENAINLQEVIVQVASDPPYKREKPLPPARISILKDMVPPGVAFILMEP